MGVTRPGRYDLHLWRRIDAATACDRMAMTLSAYNGGLGWLGRDKRLAESSGLDPARWWGHVEAVNAGRASWAIAKIAATRAAYCSSWRTCTRPPGGARGCARD